MLRKEDAEGISIENALTGFGLDAARLPLCILDDDVIGYLEFHIEQGAVLESQNLSLGVVEAIAGQTRAELDIHRAGASCGHHAHAPAARRCLRSSGVDCRCRRNGPQYSGAGRHHG